MIIDIVFYSVVVVVFFLCIILFWGIIAFFTSSIYGAPFIPSNTNIIEKSLDIMGDITGKKIYDLGCGDGRLVFEASKRGANAVGVEVSFWVYIFARIKQKMGNHSGTIIHGSLWDMEYNDADIIYLYLLPSMMQEFSDTIASKLPKGCCIISHGFSLPGYTPIQEKKLSKKNGKVFIYTL